jgi:hypothetical protein
MRVQVMDGTGKNVLGFGEYTEDVTTYVMQMPDGSLLSLPNAEQVPKEIPVGAKLRMIPTNPKIVMDDGKVVYGCQVWWSPVDDAELN